jgi:hypothetical protein
MAYNVKFVKGTASGYSSLSTKDSNTLYFITDTGALYLGTTLIADKTDLSTVNSAIGTLSSLKTTSKTDLVTAVNEVFDKAASAATAASNAATNSKVTLTTAATPTSGYLKTYVVSQGGSEVGKIDIPKDLVVTSGSVVVNPTGQDAGTYIALVIANQSTPIYINVKDLCDVYTAASGATRVQLTVSDTNVISADLVSGSISSGYLASNAVTTAKIAGSAVTTAKLDSTLQTAIIKAGTAVQSVTTGTTNGTIAVDGTNVSVKGLGSAAYTASTAYDAAGTAATKIAALDATVSQTSASSNGYVAASVVETDGKLTSVSVTVDSTKYDASGAASSALTSAKAYTDTALTWGSL